MGINKKEGTPIGFCFVVFSTHNEAKYAVQCLSSTKLDNRVIRVDWDIGFSEGRQYGRGTGGIQWRDVMRKAEDPDRPKLPENLKPKKTNTYNNKNEKFKVHEGTDSESGDEGFKRKKLKQK